MMLSILFCSSIFLHCREVKSLIMSFKFKYKLVRELESLDPRRMCDSAASSVQKFSRILSKFIEIRHVTPTLCLWCQRAVWDITVRCQKGLQRYIRDNVWTSSFTPVSLTKTQATHSCGKWCYAFLWQMVKMILVLSHGQSDIERRFSINRDIMADNTHEQTVIAYRQVIDGLQKMGCNTMTCQLAKRRLSAVLDRTTGKVLLDEQKKKDVDAEKLRKKRKR